MIEDIKKIRHITGASIKNCEEALNKSNGNKELAILWLRDKAFGGNRFEVAQRRLDEC